MSLDSLEARFAAFGYAVRHVDGNDVAALSDLFAQLPFEPGKPNLVLAHTVKGKGISFIEDKVKWHHHVPTDQEYATAISELELSAQQFSKQEA
jgi:transketolase